MTFEGLYSFIQARKTRSGREYGQVAVASITSPSSFRLSAVLESALATDPGADCFGTETDISPTYCQAENDAIEASTSSSSGSEVPQLPTVPDQVTAAHIKNSNEHGSDFEESRNSNGKRARKCRYRQSRKAQRFEAQNHLPEPPVLLKQLNAAVEHESSAKIQTLPFSSCGYQASNPTKPAAARGSQALSSLLECGYRLIQYVPGRSQPIIDPETKKIFAVVVGTPDDPSYTESAQKAFQALDEARKGLKFSQKEKNTMRGRFSFINYGISHGQGSKEPHWLDCGHEDAIRKLLANKHLIRLAKFANHAFAMWAPKTYGYYRSTMAKLVEKMPDLKWRFWESAWPCTTFNFGPRVCCSPHRDTLNLAFGWCCIIALGNYDYKLGGHLVLHDLRLVIEFPPGAVILIPSALLLHGNTPVQPGEVRMSFTQFCSAGIFRFVENGFICEEDLKTSDPQRYNERLAAKEGRKEFGIGLWSTAEDLLNKVLQ